MFGNNFTDDPAEPANVRATSSHHRANPANRSAKSQSHRRKGKINPANVPIIRTKRADNRTKSADNSTKLAVIRTDLETMLANVADMLAKSAMRDAGGVNSRIESADRQAMGGRTWIGPAAMSADATDGRARYAGWRASFAGCSARGESVRAGRERVGSGGGRTRSTGGPSARTGSL